MASSELWNIILSTNLENVVGTYVLQYLPVWIWKCTGNTCSFSQSPSSDFLFLDAFSFDNFIHGLKSILNLTAIIGSKPH